MNAPYDPLSAAGPGTGLDHPPSYWVDTAGAAPADDGPAPSRLDAERSESCGKTPLPVDYWTAGAVEAAPDWS